MLGHYLTVAYRDILRQPVSTVIGILILSLGLVCMVAAYAIVNYWANSDGQFSNIDRTYVITAALEVEEQGIRTGIWPFTNIDYAKYVEAEYPNLVAVARSIRAPDVSISTDDRGVRAVRMLVDPSFARIFDLPFVAGDASTALTMPRSIVLTEESATSLFGGESPLGQKVVLAGNVEATVTGVVQSIGEPSHLADVDFFGTWDIVDAIQFARNPHLEELPEPRENWFGGYCCTTYVLLPDDGSFTGRQLDEQLAEFPSRRLSAEELTRFHLDVGAIPLNSVSTTALDSNLFGQTSDLLSITTILFSLGGLILAVACVNYANLATSRALARSREVGLRKVVGATRAQLATQYLLESALLVTLALGLAVVGLALVMPLVKATVEIDLAAVSIFSGSHFLVFLGLLLVLVTLAAGAYPAVVLSAVRPVEALRLGKHRSGPRRVSRLLVGCQFFGASLLLVLVIVMYAQGRELRISGLGAIDDPLLVIDNASALSGVSEEALRAELRRIPQVQSVTSAAQPPWMPGINLNMISRTEDPVATGRSVITNFVGYEFFDVFDIPLVAGRVFSRERSEDVMPPFDEQRPDRTINVVLDASFAEELGFESSESAIGEMLYWPRGTLLEPDYIQSLRVIGVVENRPLHLSGIGANSNFFALLDDLEYVIVRIDSGDVTAALEGIDAMWNRVSPSMPRSRRFLDEIFNESYELFDRLSKVFVTLALMACFISVVGLFGTAAQAAESRRQEIGIRKTLGATVRQIVEMLLRDFGKPVVIANAIAWPIGFLIVNVYLSVFMHRIPVTPLPFVATLIITTGIAWATVASQSVRAARVRPADVLRSE